MTEQTVADIPVPSREEFAALLDKSFASNSGLEGSIVYGHVTAIENDYAIIDIGMKTEGRVRLREFRPHKDKDKDKNSADAPSIAVGDEVEVYLEHIENLHGEAILSREKALREEIWAQIEEEFRANRPIKGEIWNRVKGGFMVNILGTSAFLPGSQVDLRPMRDVSYLMNTPLEFRIIKMDRQRGNIVVSRRALLEEQTSEQREAVVKNIQEGQEMEGVIKNITDYGAFVDLGGIDGLLHVTDIAWRRINHPSEVLKVGEKIKTKIIRINPETQRISLGIKQMEKDPWDGIDTRYEKGQKVKGIITNITEYGAFAQLEESIEGLVHISEMSWSKKHTHPGKLVQTGQEIEMMVLEVDMAKRRISLGIKQCSENPWEKFAEKYPAGTRVKGEIKNITEFGLFVGLDEEIDGMVHMSDLSWSESGDIALANYSKGQTVEAIILEVNKERERIGLGIKQLQDDPLSHDTDLQKGTVVTCTVTSVQDAGIEVAVGEKGLVSFIRRSDLSRDRAEQRPERFAEGNKVDALITSLNQKTRRITLSIKALEIQEEKEAIAQYGSSDSGASLGDILGEALERNQANATDSKPDDTGTDDTGTEPEAKKASAKTDDAPPGTAKDAKDDTDKPEESAAQTPASDAPERDGSKDPNDKV